eukprot:2241059-Pleurochrysis_carterae.AAC.4
MDEKRRRAQAPEEVLRRAPARPTPRTAARAPRATRAPARALRSPRAQSAPRLPRQRRGPPQAELSSLLEAGSTGEHASVRSEAASDSIGSVHAAVHLYSKARAPVHLCV